MIGISDKDIVIPSTITAEGKTYNVKKIADNANSEYVLPWTRQACLDAYKRAGLTVDEIDVFETHDCFSSSEFAAISAFGIAESSNSFSTSFFLFDDVFELICYI